MIDGQEVWRRQAEAEGLGHVVAKLDAGERLDSEDGVFLYRHPNLSLVGRLANRVRETLHGDRAFYVRNQHINYTNVCNKGCRFCSFARSPRDGGPTPYRLSADDVSGALARYAGMGLSEVHMVGGIDPRIPYEYYTGLLDTIRSVIPGVHIKAFTVVELESLGRISGLAMPGLLADLSAHGLCSVPGGGAEVLSERVHSELHPRKLGPDEWIGISREVARAGMPQYATMLYGHIETIEERVAHLVRLRELQDETGHFLAFTPLSFHPEGSYLDHLPAPTGQDDLRAIAVARLMLDNIAHIKTFWIMNTAEVSQVALWYGADDFDGTVQEYEITYAEGKRGERKQALTRTRLLELIQEAGRTACERDSLYRSVG